MGLSGIVLSFAGIVGFTGCKSTIDEEVHAIMYHSNEIRKILKVEPEEACQIVETTIKKGEPFSVIIKGEKENKLITFYDTDKDGKYDEKNIFTIPHKLDIIIVPSEPNQPRDELKKYFQEKKNELQKKDKSKLWVYDN